jgi:RHS repeat-associated protein
LTNSWANYNANNQLTGTAQASGGVPHDEAGNVLYDGRNQYLYDGEGRICAVLSLSDDPPVMTGYIYDADGTRVSKGWITAWSCDPSSNGFTTRNDYILGPSGEQMTEMGISRTATPNCPVPNTPCWQHANAWAGGKLLATYDDDGLHFYFDDPLGTRRSQTDFEGVVEKTCPSFPFGDGPTCAVNPPTEHFFTGKERDSESGNDYFGARYYGSSMGRFMSPDWSPFPMAVPFALRENPQSLNLYNYVLDNPLKSVDRNGHYHCNPDWSESTPNGIIVHAGQCYFDPGDFPNTTVARAQDWFNRNLNPVYHIMAIPLKISIHTQRLKDDMTLYNTAFGAALAMLNNPIQMDDKQFVQSLVTAINAEKDYENTAVFGVGADLMEVVGLAEQAFPGSGTAVENAIKSGMDISEDSLSKTIQTAQGIKTE